MAETVLCYLMETCAGWPAEYTLWKWESRGRVEGPAKGAAASPALELLRDPARADAEAVFACSLLMKLGGWEKFRRAYGELGNVIARGAAVAGETGTGADGALVPAGKGKANGLPLAEVDRLVERERRLLPRYEALFLRGVCGLQLVGAGEPGGELRVPPGGSNLSEHPPLGSPLKKDQKARNKEHQQYWYQATQDLEAYVREAGPDAKNGVDALYLLAYHRLVHDRDPKGFLTFFRAAQLAEPKRPPTWPPIQNAHLKNILSAELKFYEGSAAGKPSSGPAASGEAGAEGKARPAGKDKEAGAAGQILRNVAWPVVDFPENLIRA
ncbi:hypothetical protein DFJ74DRAFT_664037 [Hyaloraphidium curvatum]|nr:hypothetical protein DFJ74DRAFT_664037 [Hyaloraphidium curvatum]